MGFDYVFSNHEAVAILVGIAIVIICIAVFIQRRDKKKEGDDVSITEMKKPKIRP